MKQGNHAPGCKANGTDEGCGGWVWTIDLLAILFSYKCIHASSFKTFGHLFFVEF